MAKRNFKDKVVVITGATGGLGRELCFRFGKAGAKITALDLNAAPLEDLQKELLAKQIQVFTSVCDVTDEQNCQNSIAAARQKFGKIDTLINNAGITHIERFRPEQTKIVKKIMDVNVMGSVYCTAAVLDDIIMNKGMFINLSSVAGFAPLVGRTGYSASKFALHGFFESLRAELKENGVNVLMVCPSFINTGIGETTNQPKTTVGSYARPSDVANLIFQAAEQERKQLITGRTGKLSWIIRKLAPGLYEHLMIGKMKDVQ